jgi:sec-independent protein translocase protein TatB
MFDIAPSEFLLVAFVALVVIGPKDLPKAMRVVGYWVGRARAVGRQFRAGFDEMVREAELEEMEKKWKAENERIMREHPAIPPPATDEVPATDAPVEMQAPRQHWVETPRESEDAGQEVQGALPLGDEQKPVMVEKPHVVPGDDAPDPGLRDRAAS